MPLFRKKQSVTNSPTAPDTSSSKSVSPVFSEKDARNCKQNFSVPRNQLG